MIIKARHHWFYYPFFKLFSRWMPRLDFSRVVLHNEIRDLRLPILMIGNHTTWWDGFMGQYINMEKFGRRLHIMMLEEQLRERMFLNKTGAFSIRKGNRSALESIRYTAEILSDPKNMVILFPQGSIHSTQDRPVEFERGWYRLFSNLKGPVQMVFYITLFDFFSGRKPEIHIYLYDYDYQGKSPDEICADFNRSLESSIELQKSLV